jgi:hypothetical protein
MLALIMVTKPQEVPNFAKTTLIGPRPFIEVRRGS